jgi:hypothetical protein
VKIREKDGLFRVFLHFDYWRDGLLASKACKSQTPDCRIGSETAHTAGDSGGMRTEAG